MSSGSLSRLKTSADTSLRAIFDRIELSRSPTLTSRSFATNHRKYNDTSTLDSGRPWDTNLSAGRDVSQPANEFYKAVSLPNVKNQADTVTDDTTDDETDDEETDDSDVDNAFGVSPRLVSESANLSQYRSRTPVRLGDDESLTFKLVDFVKMNKISTLDLRNGYLGQVRCNNTTSYVSMLSSMIAKRQNDQILMTEVGRKIHRDF
ncbi:hypothetical protein DL98DRAFT_596282 [Cadophora sp. DSE1049]|nr:hypothetical protein DL98DRAFT_596282 [Cadophora sp. DSE1049]